MGITVISKSGLTDCIDTSQDQINLCCGGSSLAHFLSWAADLAPRAAWPRLVWALGSRATSVKSWLLITQTFSKPTFASDAPDGLLAGFHVILYYDYYNNKKSHVMKIRPNL